MGSWGQAFEGYFRDSWEILRHGQLLYSWATRDESVRRTAYGNGKLESLEVRCGRRRAARRVSALPAKKRPTPVKSVRLITELRPWGVHPSRARLLTWAQRLGTQLGVYSAVLCRAAHRQNLWRVLRFHRQPHRLCLAGG